MKSLVPLAVSSAALVACLLVPAAAAAAPANDLFANAQEIGPALPIEVPGSTVEATVEAGEELPAEGHTVWFKWTAPSSMPVRVDVCDYHVVEGPGNEGLWAYTGTTIPTLGTVAENFTGCRVSFAAVGGTTYRIKFDTYFGGEGNFVLRMIEETPPANDDFAAAQTVGPGLPISVPGSNVFATTEPGEPHHASNNEKDFPPADSVWYRWTPDTSAEVVVRDCAGDFAPRLGVYTGTAVASLTRVTTTIPLVSFPYCSLRFEAEAGTTYRIAVAGSGGEREGSFTLDIHRFVRPPNDDFENATPIGPTLPISVEGTNLDAGTESQEPDHSRFGDGIPFASVWYSWTAAESRLVRISTCGSSFSSVLSVYTGTLLDSLDKVATGEGGCEPLPGNTIDLPALAGVRYTIAIDGSGPNSEGPFTLRIFDPFASAPPAGAIPPPPGTAPKPRFSLKRALKRCRKIRRKKARRRCIHRARRKAKRLA
ncbi:MAG TPA: hypothetical protein VHQ97_04300 [Solirubrobacterales bacterium]|nr:hypothetical protein [Solirubrobacterales bacterium]